MSGAWRQDPRGDPCNGRMGRYLFAKWGHKPDGFKAPLSVCPCPSPTLSPSPSLSLLSLLSSSLLLTADSLFSNLSICVQINFHERIRKDCARKLQMTSEPSFGSHTLAAQTQLHQSPGLRLRKTPCMKEARTRKVT